MFLYLHILNNTMETEPGQSAQRLPSHGCPFSLSAVHPIPLCCCPAACSPILLGRLPSHQSVLSSHTVHPLPLARPFIPVARSPIPLLYSPPIHCQLSYTSPISAHPPHSLPLPPHLLQPPHSSIPYSSSSVFAHRPLIHSPSPPLIV